MVTNLGRIDFELVHDKVKIDVKDRKILFLLSQDARMPLTQIAKKVQLSRDAVNYRINRLEKLGIILKFYANINFERLGYYIFHVFFLLDELDKKKQNEFIETLCNHPNVTNVIEYSDMWDLEAVIISKSLLDFDRIISDLSSKFPQVIVEKNKLELIKRYNSTRIPFIMKGITPQGFNLITDPTKTESLDEEDVKILRVLCNDARTSTYKIAEKMQVSPDKVSYRIKSMIDRGIIRNFTILLNLSKLNYSWYTYSLGLRTFDPMHENMFLEHLRNNPAIIRSAKTLGGWDLLLYVVVENQREFHKTVKELKRLFSNIIRNYQTWVACKEYIYNPLPETLTKIEKK